MTLHEKLWNVFAHEFFVNNRAGNKILKMTIAERKELFEMTLGSNNENKFGQIIFRVFFTTRFNRLQFFIDSLK